jgi:hypothetical protein
MAQDTRSPPAGPVPQGVTVRHLRQVLLWPLRLIPANPGDDPRRHPPWQLLRDMGDTSPWHEHADEYQAGAGSFHERHYNEFVTFLPYVQRFLYGDGRARRAGADAVGGSPMRVFRRRDIAAVRVQPSPGDTPLVLQVVHVDLYFFHGVDVVLLNVEVAADELPLALAQELMYRFGRAYPGGWDAQGQALNCLAGVEWLDAAGAVLAHSDAQQRETFLAHVAEHRAPRIAAHWDFVLAPLVNHHSGAPGPLRFRQIEYYRMPMMAYLAVDSPRQLTRGDFVRLGLVSSSGDAALALGEHQLAEFERQFCYDRFWIDAGAAPNTRFLCSGLSLVVVGDASSPFYRCGDRGVLSQFRHQHFLLFLIAHFQKASLLMASDQLAEALTALDISRPDSIKRFKRQIRQSYVAFLGFTHRYWFHEVSEQAQVKALFHMCTRHLQIDTLYEEVKDRIRDMNGYLDADALRRQANTVVRLTVVTIFGMIGTISTGFLGMNLIAEADAPLARRALIFFGVLGLAAAVTVYTMVKSKRLSDFLDVVSDERLPAWTKLKSFAEVWRTPR